MISCIEILIQKNLFRISIPVQICWIDSSVLGCILWHVLYGRYTAAVVLLCSSPTEIWLSLCRGASLSRFGRPSILPCHNPPFWTVLAKSKSKFKSNLNLPNKQRLPALYLVVVYHDPSFGTDYCCGCVN